MLPCLIILSISLEFQLYGQELTISGQGAITQEEVQSKCDPKAVRNIIINDGITSIDTLSFYRFDILQSIKISKTVQSIVSDSTRFCSQLSEFILDPYNEYFSVDNQGALYDKQKTVLIRLPPQKNTFKIPTTVVTIEQQALQACVHLKQLVFPSNVKYLSIGMIYDTYINDVTFEKNSKVETFVTHSFAYTSLEKIFIPKSVTSIETDAFYASTKLTTVIFEEDSNLNLIKSYAFRECNLYNFSFPSKLTTIEHSIFTQNMNLAKIHIPNSLVNININAFAGCPNIFKIEIDQNNANFKLAGTATLTDFQMTKYYYISKNTETFNIPQTITEIPALFIQICPKLTALTINGNQIFSTDGKILYNSDKSTALSCSGGVGTVSIDGNCQSINPYCFYMVKKLEKINFLGNNLKRIDGYAFSNTYALKTIIFPSSLTELYDFAFFQSSVETLSFEHNSQLNSIGHYCFMESNITSIIFGNQLQTINNQAFYFCRKLKHIKFDPNCPLETLPLAMMMNTSLTEFTVPLNLKNIDERVLAHTITLKKVIFPENCKIVKLGPRAFSQTGIENLILPKSLTSIESSCFSECDFLNSITFEEICSLTTLTAGIFKNCNALPTVTLPKSITKLDASVFQGCSSLMNIFIDSENSKYKNVDGVVYTKDTDELVAYPGGRVTANVDNWVRSIGSNAFYNCSKLKNVTFNNNIIEVIPISTFEECNVIQRVIFPKSLKYIRSRAFYKCSLLHDFIFPESLISVDSFSFFNCSNFIKLIVPSSMNRIGSNSFSYCNNLRIIEFNTKSLNIENNAFLNCFSLLKFRIKDYISFDSAYSGIRKSSIVVHYYGLYDIESLFIADITKTVYVNCSYYNKTFCSHNVIRTCQTESYDAKNHMAFFEIFIFMHR